MQCDRVTVRMMQLGFLVCYNGPGERYLNQGRCEKNKEEEEIPVCGTDRTGQLSACVV